MDKLILFQGDSITDCGRDKNAFVSTGHGYVRLIKAALGFEQPGKYSYLNRGISGNRVVDLYARIKRDIINLKPDYLSILIGVNDVWHEYVEHNGVSAEKYEKIYDMLIQEIKEELPELKIMLLEPFALPGKSTESTEEFPSRWEYFRSEVDLRSAAVKRIAQKHELLFVPLQEVFDKACDIQPASYWLNDGVHPSPYGHELIKREWMKAFESMTVI